MSTTLSASGSTAAAQAVSAPLNPKARRFLAKLTLVTGGGMFIDGYVFAVIGITLALAPFTHDLGVSTLWSSWISSATLIGIFLSAFICGRLTDRYGRRGLFIADLATFAVAAVVMFFVQTALEMFVLALIMGFAVGADYAIGSPLVSEFAPSNLRGKLTSTLQIAWNVGYVIAYLIGYFITKSNPGAWRWILLSACVPAVLALLGRIGLPESPRWLVSKGRKDEAEKVLKDHLDWNLESQDFGEEAVVQAPVRDLFTRAQTARTIFACAFWICLVLPYFGIIFFQPEVLKALNVVGTGTGATIFAALIGTIVALVGVTIGVFLVERVGRRKLLIGPLWVCGAALIVVAFDNALPSGLIAVCFFLYLFSYGIASMLCGVYPMELFPTTLRTTGVGFASSMSRVGAAAGTFLFPYLLRWSVSVSMIVMAIVCIIGAIMSQIMAPETKGKTLTEAANMSLLKQPASLK